jgi:hypothetical protein
MSVRVSVANFWLGVLSEALAYGLLLGIVASRSRAERLLFGLLAP